MQLDRIGTTGDADPEDIIEEQSNLEDIVEHFVPSDYATPHAMLAKKSGELGRFVDENPLIAKAVKKMLLGCRIYAQEHGLRPNEIDADYKMTSEGRIVVTLRRAW